MTTFGWDTSHFDGIISKTTALKAASEGIQFATAKIGEGGNYDDPADGSNLKAFRDAGIKVIGGYYVVRSQMATGGQVAHCVGLADRDEPWWRDFPGWFWQVDLELWGYDNVSAAKGIDFGRQLKAATHREVVMYASRGQYNGKLKSWAPGLLWNAHYASNRHAPFKDLYPGDDFVGWNPYSGMTPVVLQYASTATIGDLTTCDANAYRGTIDQLFDLISWEAPVTVPTPQQNAAELMSGLQEDNKDKGYTGKVKISAGTDLGDGADAAREARDILKSLPALPGVDEATLRQIIAEEIGNALNATSLTYTVVLNDKV